MSKDKPHDRLQSLFQAEQEREREKEKLEKKERERARMMRQQEQRNELLSHLPKDSRFEIIFDSGADEWLATLAIPSLDLLFTSRKEYHLTAFKAVIEEFIKFEKRKKKDGV